MNKLQAGVVGASGFGGAELLRLLADHPSIEIAAVFGESSAGRRLAELFPALGAHAAGTLVVAPFEHIVSSKAGL
jgi:N-acetyl-gamma-glutamyl-phosphate reductase